MNVVRRSTLACCCWLFSVAAATAEESSAPSKVVLERCLISLIAEAEAPAQEAGVIVEMAVREGQQVSRDALIARIDDATSQLQKLAAEAERSISYEKSTNDVDVRYADATRKVAAAEYQMNHEANLKVRGTKSAAELQELQLKIEQAALQIEQARHEQFLASLETQANDAKVGLANNDIRRRRICAPIDGEVVELLVHAGEWVHPGDPVARVIRMDRLRVEGFLNAEKFSASEISGKPIEVVVRFERGRTATFDGKIVFVDPRVQAGGEYRVWAEVENRRDEQEWLLRPGFSATMTIHLQANTEPLASAVTELMAIGTEE
jgi:RND family efflux transporter MFP subunit